jgi:hypothetical protein
MKNVENKGFLPISNVMGQSVPAKMRVAFRITNKINGFMHVFYGSAVKKYD